MAYLSVAFSKGGAEMSDKALVVLTGKSKDRLFREGGTSDWAIAASVGRGF